MPAMLDYFNLLHCLFLGLLLCCETEIEINVHDGHVLTSSLSAGLYSMLRRSLWDVVLSKHFTIQKSGLHM